MDETPPTVINADDAVIALTNFVRNVADLDDLARLYSMLIADGKIAVKDENGESDVFEDGERP